MHIHTTCPGCGVQLPKDNRLIYDGYFNCSAECWQLFAELQGEQYADIVRYGSVFQLTVDAYAVHHAGGPHPDKSVDVHLAGLYLAFEQQVPVNDIAPILQRLIAATPSWPHFEPPSHDGLPTLFDAALDGTAAAYRQWAHELWQRWRPHHAAVARLLQSVTQA